jgi:hypothetical protein
MRVRSTWPFVIVDCFSSEQLPADEGFPVKIRPSVAMAVLAWGVRGSSVPGSDGQIL